MKNLHARTLILFSLLFPLLLSAQTGELARNFKNPPAEYSLLPFWSWNGTLKPAKLKWQIDQMQEKGIDGAFMHARSGLDESETPYFSEGFWNAVDTAVQYSASKGFHTYLYDEDKWPSGSAGGRTVAANPEEFVKKTMNYSKMELVGPQTITLSQQKKPMAIFAGRISEKGVYDFSSQINLTGKANSTWNVPAGRWAILSFEMVKDPQKQIDYLDSAAVAKFIEITHEAYYKRYGKYFGNTIPGVFFDEIYANGSSMDDNIFWTDDFAQKFQKIKGYELNDKLPLILLNDPANSAKLRYDYFDVVKQLYVKAWFKQYADWCASHHIFATGHTTEKMVHYKRQSDYFTTIGQLQVPGTDNEEYRYGYPRMIDWYNTKQISSIANLYQRKRVMAESMGSGGYTIPLEEYKYGFSMLGVYGINLFIPHLFHYATDTPESQSDWPPSWFYTNPYWKYFRPLGDFAKRIAYLNAQGREVCDVAILFPLTDLWEGGYPARVEDTFYKEVQQELLDNHLNYNIIDPASLASATISNKGIEAGFGKYRVLILPEIHALTSAVLKQIADFVGKGGTVIALKSLPAFSESGPNGDEQLAANVKELFGFHPNSLHPEEYFQWNLDRTEHFTVKTNPSSGAAYFTRFLSQLPEIIRSRIPSDVEVQGENGKYFRFNHRQTDGSESFLMVNDRNTPEKYHLSLKNIGIPSIWNPETGDISPLQNYRVNKKRMEMVLNFEPRQSYFLVLEPGKPDSINVLVDQTDLSRYGIRKNDSSVTVEGWGQSDEVHQVTLRSGEQLISKSWKSSQQMIPLQLDCDWQFQLAPKALDQIWDSRLEADTLELPVMKFQPERVAREGTGKNWNSVGLDDADWKTVKITDDFNHLTGIQRYLSNWDGWWISYYDYSQHLPPTEGGNRTFRKELELKAGVKEAKLALTADQSYELLVNGQTVGKDKDWKTVEMYDLTKLLKQGTNQLEVRTKNTRGVLLEGSVRLKNGQSIALRSDDSWMVTAGQSDWQPAFRFAAPPMGIWGELQNPLSKAEFPLTVWYRQLLPPGAKGLKCPVIKGKYTIFLNGKPLSIDPTATSIDLSSLLQNGNNLLALKVMATDPNCGLIQPLSVVCGKTSKRLIPWNDMGLGWYSGRAIYTKTVNLPPSFLAKDMRLMLDLGVVDHFAEIWVNGKLVTYCPWPPFKADISGFVKEGENVFSVVVANLVANRASWNILDANLPNREARWWHDGSILREREKLVSGLLGPVQIVPYKKESINIELTK